MTRLCLGTVQFGMDYGVQGGRRPPVADAVSMLDFALAYPSIFLPNNWNKGK